MEKDLSGKVSYMQCTAWKPSRFFLQTVIKKEQLGGISGKDFFGIQFKSHQTTICLICLTFKSFPFEFPVFYLSLMC